MTRMLSILGLVLLATGCGELGEILPTGTEEDGSRAAFGDDTPAPIGDDADTGGESDEDTEVVEDTPEVEEDGIDETVDDAEENDDQAASGKPGACDIMEYIPSTCPLITHYKTATGNCMACPKTHLTKEGGAACQNMGDRGKIVTIMTGAAIAARYANVQKDGTTGACLTPAMAAKVVGSKRLGAGQGRTWSMEAALPPITWRAFERKENPAYDIASQGRVFIQYACETAVITNTVNFAKAENLQCYIDRLLYLSHHCPNNRITTFEKINKSLAAARAVATRQTPPCPTPPVTLDP